MFTSFSSGPCMFRPNNLNLPIPPFFWTPSHESKCTPQSRKKAFQKSWRRRNAWLWRLDLAGLAPFFGGTSGVRKCMKMYGKVTKIYGNSMVNHRIHQNSFVGKCMEKGNEMLITADRCLIDHLNYRTLQEVYELCIAYKPYWWWFIFVNPAPIS